MTFPCFRKNLSGGCATRDLPSAVAVDPTNPLVVYTGGRLGGIYKSTDGGATWSYPAAAGVTTEVYNAGMPFFDPTTIFVHPRNPSIVLVGIGQTGIFRSTDGGTSFAKAMSGVKTSAVGETAAAATRKQVGEFVYDRVTRNVLVGMKTGVYRSTNDGASWTPSGKGLPTDGMGGGVNFGNGALQQSPVNPKLLVYFGSFQAHLWGSADGGRTWKRLSTSGMAISPSSDHLTWLDAAVFDSRKPTTLYVGTGDRGVYKTKNGAGILGGTKQR